MKIYILVFLASMTTSAIMAQYTRRVLKSPPHQGGTIYPHHIPRGPSPLPPSQLHNFMKKWQNLHLPPQGISQQQLQQQLQQQPQQQQQQHRRYRPIPVHMPNGHKIAMGVPNRAQSVIVSPPVRTFWKNTQNRVPPPPQNQVQQIPQSSTTIQLGTVPSLQSSLNTHQYQYQQVHHQQSNEPVVHQHQHKQPTYHQHHHHQQQSKVLNKHVNGNNQNNINKVNQFLSSPQINLPEYDLHLQANTIPTHHTPIKQVGEKGPIHTIPAPNLTAADKPKNFEQNQHIAELQKQQQEYQQHLQQEQQIQQQLQQEQQIQQQLQQEQQQLQQQHQQQTFVQIQKAHQYQVTEDELKPTDLFSSPSQQQQQNQKDGSVLDSSFQKELFQFQSSDQQENQQLSQKELYRLMYPQQDGYQQQNQQQPKQQVVNVADFADLENFPTIQSQFFNQQQFQQPEAEDKIGNSNYKDTESKGNGLTKQEISSLVTSSYNLEPNYESRYVQKYFEEDQHLVGGQNKVQVDAKPSDKVDDLKIDLPNEEEEGDLVNEEEEDSNNESPFYTSLPSKKAADSLASLQAAGKVNSNLMELSKEGSSSMKILVPEESENGSRNNNDDADGDDYNDEEMVVGDSLANDAAFGHRLNPKSI